MSKYLLLVAELNAPIADDMACGEMFIVNFCDKDNIAKLMVLLMIVYCGRAETAVGYIKHSRTTCGTTSISDASANLEECKLLCAQYETCIGFVWSPQTPEKQCRLKRTCSVQAGAPYTYYQKTSSVSNMGWADGPDIPGLVTYQDVVCDSDADMTHAPTIGSNKCAMMAVLAGWHGATWQENSQSCYQRMNCGNFKTATNPQTTYVPHRRFRCIPGFSCYVLFRKNNNNKNGVLYSEAKAMCGSIGGYLANLYPLEEVNTVRLESELVQMVWVGMQKVGTSWKWLNDGVPQVDVNWEPGEPNATFNGTPVALSEQTWTFKSMSSSTARAHALCELQSITKMVRGGLMIPGDLNDPHHTLYFLNDGDVNTCFNPGNDNNVMNMKLVTKWLNPDGDTSTFVKIHGEGIVCDNDINNSNIVVMTTADSNMGLYNLCGLHAGYQWQGKQLCLYLCQCLVIEPCDNISLRFVAAAKYKICEFGVV